MTDVNSSVKLQIVSNTINTTSSPANNTPKESITNHDPKLDSVSKTNAAPVVKPKYVIYADPENSKDDREAVEFCHRTAKPSNLFVHSGPLDAREIRMIMHQIDNPSDRLRLVRGSPESILSEDEIKKIKNGDMSVLPQKLAGESGLVYLARPIVSCAIAGTIAIGNNQQEIGDVLKEDMCQGMASKTYNIVSFNRTSSNTSFTSAKQKENAQDASHTSQSSFTESLNRKSTKHVGPQSMRSNNSASNLPQNTSIVSPTTTKNSGTHAVGASNSEIDEIIKVSKEIALIESKSSSTAPQTKRELSQRITKSLLSSVDENNVSSSQYTSSNNSGANPTNSDASNHSYNASLENSNMLLRQSIGGSKSKMKTNRYILFADPADATCNTIIDIVKCLTTPEEYNLVSTPLEPREMNMIVSVLDPTERHRLVRDYKTSLTESDRSRIARGDTRLLTDMLCGPDGLKKLVRPILFCGISGTIVIGNNIEEIRNVIRESGWDSVRSSSVDKTSNSVPLGLNAGSKASKTISPAQRAMLESTLSIHTVSRPLSNSESQSVASSMKATGAAKSKYIVYYDPNDPDSVETCIQIASKVPPGVCRLITGPLDRREIRMIQYNMDANDRISLCRNADKQLTPNEHARIRRDDMDVLANKLCGHDGLAHLVRPIVVCPVAGITIVGHSPDKFGRILEEDGWHKSLINKPVTVQIATTALPHMLSSSSITNPFMTLSHSGSFGAISAQKGQLTSSGTGMMRSPSSRAVGILREGSNISGSSGTQAPAPCVKSKYVFIHDPSLFESQQMLDLLRERTNSTNAGSDIHVITGPLSIQDVKPILSILDAREQISLLTQPNVLSPEDVAKVKAGRPDALIRAITGEAGLKNLVKPIVMCPLLGTALVGYKPNDLPAIMSEDMWGHTDSGVNARLSASSSSSEKKQSKNYGVTPQKSFVSVPASSAPSRPDNVHVSSMHQPGVSTMSITSGNASVPSVILPSTISSDRGADSGPVSSASIPGLPNAASLLGHQVSNPALIASNAQSSHSSAANGIQASVSRQNLSTQSSSLSRPKFVLYHDGHDQKSLEVLKILEDSVPTSDYRVITSTLDYKELRPIVFMLDPQERLSLCRSTVGILEKHEVDRIIKGGDIDLLAQKLSGDTGAKYLFRPILVNPVSGVVVVGAKIPEIKEMLHGGSQAW